MRRCWAASVGAVCVCIGVLWLSACGSSATGGGGGGGGTGRLTNLFFLHHSVGEGLVVEGGLRGRIAAYNTAHGTAFALWDHGYNGDGLRNPAGQATGTSYDVPNDNTDTDGLFNLWTGADATCTACRNRILANHQVIVLKSCFPNSDIPDAAALLQRQQWYQAMRTFFDTRPDRLFILLTSPPLHRLATNATAAANARTLATWLASTAFVGGHANLRCYNLFDALAHPDDGSAAANMLRYEYEGSHDSDDSHPNTTGNTTVAPLLAEFICDAAADYTPPAR